MEKNCQICTESFTNVKRKPINCSKCQFTACTDCFKRNCLNGSDPICMNPDCRSVFSEAYLYENLSYNFMIGKYRDKKVEILLEREKSLFEGSMSFVENRILREKTKAKIKELKKQKLEIANQLYEQQLNLNRLYQNEQLRDLDLTNQNETKEDKKKNQSYLKKCPTENCKGFLNLAYKCNLCEISVCSKCFGIKTEDHECNENELKTAEFLRKDTKACPNCGELIHKIQGCDQMFCIECNTGFSWSTLKIVTGTMHNPHYFEYLNRQRVDGNQTRTPENILCGAPPNANEITTKFSQIFEVPISNQENYNRGRYNYRQQYYNNYNYYNNTNTTNNELSEKSNKDYDYALFMLQLCTHNAQVEVHHYNQTEFFRINLEDRIKFMRNVLDEKIYRKNILKRYNENIRKNEIIQIFQTFQALIEDKLRSIILPETNSVEKLRELINECRHITTYVNNCFQKLSNTFKTRTPKIINQINKNNIIYGMIVDRSGSNYEVNSRNKKNE